MKTQDDLTLINSVPFRVRINGEVITFRVVNEEYVIAAKDNTLKRAHQFEYGEEALLALEVGALRHVLVAHVIAWRTRDL